MLRLQIDGRWEPEDFIEVLKGVESLYYKAVLSHRYPGFPYEPPFYWRDRDYLSVTFEQHLDLTNDWLLACARATVRGEHRLKVRRVSYASPGGIDLVGIGQACSAVKDVILDIIRHCGQRELRRQAEAQSKIETDMKEESLRAMKIENARKILDMRRDFPDIPKDIFTALIGSDQDRLIPRVVDKKLIGVEVIQGDSPKGDKGD